MPYGKDSVISSILDRRGSSVTMSFRVNGTDCGSEPAFVVPEEKIDGALFFAVCGRPGFKLRIVTVDIS